MPNEDEHLTWTSVYMQYGVQREAEHDSLDQALSFLFWGEDRGELSSDYILGPDGAVVIRAGSPEWREREEAWEKMWAGR